MSKYPLPEFDTAIQRLSEQVGDCAANLRDFRDALNASDSPDVIVDEYDSRRLLRRLSDNDYNN